MKEEIGSDYDDQVAFYMLGSEPIDRMLADKESNGYPWPVAYADRSVWETLRIYAQGSKVALSADGVILHRYGLGKGDFPTWNAFFDDIAAN